MQDELLHHGVSQRVSMESGLEDRNNPSAVRRPDGLRHRLNGVRPRRPEQLTSRGGKPRRNQTVSMESGLEDRNNVGGDCCGGVGGAVSMESGLEDRNNHLPK